LLEVLQLEAILSVNLQVQTRWIRWSITGVATRTGAKPLQDPTSYNEHEDQERDNGVTTHCLGRCSDSRRTAILTGLHVSPVMKALSTATPRMYGAVQNGNPSKLTVYNANDVLQDDHQGNAHSRHSYRCRNPCTA
jgi:hypothetical protein